MARFFFTVVVLIISAWGAFAETRVALIVANGAYRDLPLANPTVDASLIVKALDALGFETVVVENASLAIFDDSVTRFAAKARGADIALFYYAGHGFAVSDRGGPRNYLMAVDVDVTSNSERVLRAGGMPLDDVISVISESAKTTLIFVDACRNDPTGRASGGRGRGAVALDNSVGDSVFVGLSTRLGDVASDGVAGAGSPFARAFAANIGIVDARLDDAFTTVRLAVEQETLRKQRPDVARYDLSGPVVLARAATPKPEPLAPPVVDTRDANDPCRDAGIHWAAISELDDAALVEEHLRLFPTCAFATLARLQMDRLEEAPTVPATECDRLAASAADPNRVSDGVEFDDIDVGRATPACQRVVESFPRVPRLIFQLARVLDKAGQYDGALRAYREAADLGHPVAMNNLGHLFEQGNGVEQDYAKAREWYAKAVAEGNPAAMGNLGRLYDSGEGGTQDYAKARELYEQAARDNDPTAMFHLGFLYAHGQGTTQDYVKASEWYEKAVTLGDADAMFALALLADRGLAGSRGSSEAARLIERSIRQGHVVSKSHLKRNPMLWSDSFRKDFQHLLKEAGVYGGSLDGAFGIGTQTAIDAIFGKAG